jgi:hypothetical protein
MSEIVLKESKSGRCGIDQAPGLDVHDFNHLYSANIHLATEYIYSLGYTDHEQKEDPITGVPVHVFKRPTQ